ncbi:hypothetical protein DSM106972_031850 [Dulcicalothrix desertica PCC 7102]|uniref:Uncharacterized protein n=1 Tax=Dulcicalothrix desertica PCC 7102 TaxID=232991 RepID=A0A3S1CEW2_9CYAN|nr:hypothetical protein [Dulcicalothrix desertica]RUT05979.1 hypothetical protein DSM106972_031850 [Dulcicalothrix desertica PCC 7102]TWH54345.1 hypothetical protein CAL7102_02371 [Dulcicalothrix desertica PCC 7102]
METDLLGLEISKGELRRLTGFDPDEVFRPSIMRDKKKRLGFIGNELMVALALTPLIVGFIYAFLILPTIGTSIPLGLALIIIVPIVVLITRWFWRLKTCPKVVTVLLDEVDRYHAVIQSIYINDQLATSGNKTSHIEDREKVISGLQLIREDLVRALKTERILRDNKELLANNQELSINNLSNLQALQVSTEASEYAQVLNQSLQIAIDVQAEIRKLQSQR